MSPAWTAVTVLAVLGLAVSATCLGWVLARWVAGRRGPDFHEMRARQRFLDALVDPKPGRWQ